MNWKSILARLAIAEAGIKALLIQAEYDEINFKLSALLAGTL